MGNQEKGMIEQEKILVVDDDRLLRTMVREILSRRGHSVEEAENAHKALALLQKENFPIIILDIMMPEITGIELMEEIRKIDPNVLIIIITAYATMDLAIDALKKGAYDFLKKPFEPEELLKSVSNALLQSWTSRRNRELLEDLEDKVHKLSKLNIEIERGKATLQQIMESINTGIVVTDFEGRFVRLNGAARRILGVLEKEEGRKLRVPAKSYRQLMAIINSGLP
ncbi:MAG: response regulator, partial [Acidobacteriota bacterium]